MHKCIFMLKNPIYKELKISNTKIIGKTTSFLKKTMFNGRLQSKLVKWTYLIISVTGRLFDNLVLKEYQKPQVTVAESVETICVFAGKPVRVNKIGELMIDTTLSKNVEMNGDNCDSTIII